ncbi:hypothetical protein DFH07DRAFT_166211 [Mycena maculata]|uniref:Uncharacterized protein n=1 Tax=Mycena maculata TaxID=230809 RepID=A0AAD7NRU6_9AGAR|nr:hypothetical protein DFH07DRAFT_166211 [Mycena maculata]
MAGASPTRARPPPLRLDHVGINPAALIGKTLTAVRPSAKHPSLTLCFADGARVQICVDGYDPVHRGLPKALEMDAALQALFSAPEGGRGLTVADCALITLEDKAFAVKSRPNDKEKDGEDRWDQRHLGVAFKFAAAEADAEGEEGNGSYMDVGWHCVWAILQDHDQTTGECVFRTYDDVYLEHLQRSPRKQRHNRDRRKSSGGPLSASPVL